MTERQLKILPLIAKGDSNREISVVLGIPIATVKNDILAIFSELGVTNRPSVVAMAYRKGLLPVGS